MTASSMRCLTIGVCALLALSACTAKRGTDIDMSAPLAAREIPRVIDMVTVQDLKAHGITLPPGLRHVDGSVHPQRHVPAWPEHGEINTYPCALQVACPSY